MGRLKGKVALVTCAAQGIGLAISELFVQEGSYVIIADIKESSRASIVTELRDKVCSHGLDVSRESDWEVLAEFIKRNYGKLDILVNNAGINGFSLGPQDPENASLESWHKVHEVNLDGVFLGCKYGIALMKDNGGSIINISSRSGVVGIPHAAAYASSKAAIRNHTKSVALYCAEKNYNIRCNSINPAAILTAMWDTSFGSDLH